MTDTRLRLYKVATRRRRPWRPRLSAQIVPLLRVLGAAARRCIECGTRLTAPQVRTSGDAVVLDWNSDAEMSRVCCGTRNGYTACNWTDFVSLHYERATADNCAFVVALFHRENQ